MGQGSSQLQPLLLASEVKNWQDYVKEPWRSDRVKELDRLGARAEILSEINLLKAC